ncbi:aminoacyl-tRNA hydrolase [Patescibacteria group bacterium]|nr:aminoacyl-tRNA hydrolase [Patescibacteria group bacterium]
MKLIIGLGNPGKDYVGTRHNVGFEALDALAKELNLVWKKDAKRQSETAKGIWLENEIIFAKPKTFMNKSGSAAQALMAFYKIKPADLLIVHDDMDLSTSRLKLTAAGGAGGHNGIADIQQQLGRRDISRLRIGIGRPERASEAENWVLGKPPKDERKKIEEALSKTGDTIKTWIELGITRAMNKWNVKNEEKS